jgi:hypothetical protein
MSSAITGGSWATAAPGAVGGREEAAGIQPRHTDRLLRAAHYSAGFVLTPARPLSITVDERIALSSMLTGTAVSKILIGNDQSGDISALPKTKLLLGDTWTLGKWTLTGRLVRYGGFTVLQNDPTNDRHYGAKWITDAELSRQVTKALNVAVGANNIFNVYPDANGIYNASLGQGQYPTTGRYGFTGGFYYARVGVSF